MTAGPQATDRGPPPQVRHPATGTGTEGPAISPVEGGASTDGPSPWDRAMTALRLLAADPALGGIVLRARAGPVRDAFMAAARDRLGTPVRLHHGMDEEALSGGIDLTATLAAGRPVLRAGLLGAPGPFALAMAERTPPALAGRLAQALDAGSARPMLALDEGAAPDERVPGAVGARLAFHVDLDAVTIRDLTDAFVRRDDAVSVPAMNSAHLGEIAGIAAMLGVDDLRALSLCARAAAVHAGLAGRAVGDADIAAAVVLVLAPRATRMPAAPEEAERPEEARTDPAPDDDETPPDATEDVTDESDTATMETAMDMLIAAARAALPGDLMDRIAPARIAGGAGSGQGARRKGAARGRPLPSRPGRPGSGRIDLVATLRGAAPWQPMRRQAAIARQSASVAKSGPPPRGVIVHPADIRIRRNEVRTDRLLIFAVDASGSAATTRLAEAKGAVELMLARAYATRDHVALIAFRGAGAEVLLAPTRSLVAAKRQLASMPGGGGTPLAAGLEAADAMALTAAARGMAPVIALLTDGRANVARDGSPGRARAAEDATLAGRRLAGRVPAVVIDMGVRASSGLEALGREMAARYLALPRADARGITAAIGAALDA